MSALPSSPALAINNSGRPGAHLIHLANNNRNGQTVDFANSAASNSAPGSV